MRILRNTNSGFLPWKPYPPLAGLTSTILFFGRLRTLCPLWVKSRHLQCTKPCPLYPQYRPRKRIPAKGRVRFTLESGHVRRVRSCLLWANSGHRTAHSITSSARPISVLGTLTPSALAVFRSKRFSQFLDTLSESQFETFRSWFANLSADEQNAILDTVM
jgi:hypothetical protein